MAEGLSVVTNEPLWWGDVDNKRGHACMGGYGKALYLPLNFATNLKLLSKVKS